VKAVGADQGHGAEIADDAVSADFLVHDTKISKALSGDYIRQIRTQLAIG
jgi:hypothetical protein